MTEDETASLFEFAKGWARKFARRKNLLRDDPDEIESRAGVAVAYALKSPVDPQADPVQFRARLCGIITRQLFSAARAASRAAREREYADLDSIAIEDYTPPSARKPTRVRRTRNE